MNRRLLQDEDSSQREAPWLNTYADMVTLILCFFVLLFAMSAINVRKFQAVIASLQGALGILDRSSQPALPPPDEGVFDAEQLRLQLLAQEMAQMRAMAETFRKELGKLGLSDKVSVEIEERGVVFRFADAVLFDIGKAELRPEARSVLKVVGQMVKKVSNPVRVEGHTDNWPIHTEKFPSNWELSTGRATSVVRFLIEEVGVPPKRLQAAGYGEFHPIDSNETAEGRQRNRRVDVILLRPSLSLAEPR